MCKKFDTPPPKRLVRLCVPRTADDVPRWMGLSKGCRDCPAGFHALCRLLPPCRKTAYKAGKCPNLLPLMRKQKKIAKIC